MKNLLKLTSLIGLVLTIVPPVFFFLGKTDMGQMKLLMGIGMAIWFVSAPFWVNKPTSKVQ
jgi:hypothetical protein